MINKFLGIIAAVLVFSGCAKKLDGVSFSDNPYDNDYSGPRVLKINNITRDTTGADKNRIYYSLSYDNYDGIKLYKNGVLLATHYKEIAHTVDFQDVYAVPGVTYNYKLVMYCGSGDTESDPVSFTTP
jgi:hypothetical protein